MFFTKFPHPANFQYAHGYLAESGRFSAGSREFDSEITAYEGGIHHIRIAHKNWGANRSFLPLIRPQPCDCRVLEPGENFQLSFFSKDGRPFLETDAERSFGVCGSAWLFQFVVSPDTHFYGLGEKNFGRLELSGIRTKFWNTDVWGDFHYAQFKDNIVDPPYLSIPYVILKTGSEYVGILVEGPGTAFIETPGKDQMRVFEAWQQTSPVVVVGAECGEPNLWVIHGPTLQELTRKLQALVGRTPAPPVWSLGYHQSRWGYAGHADLVGLDAKFTEHDFPCDGLWLDIDYMDGFRVFTFDKEHFPKGIQSTSKVIAKSGRRIVAILDPGVKKEPGNPVYDDLKEKGVYCLNPEGAEYVGIVWPGETIFPDLTLKDGRDWWAGYAQKFFEDGIGGVWLDMNDPSTGPVDPTDMLFQHGKDQHCQQRNQYALGMQMATYEGHLGAFPNQRPFLLSRSGCTGTSRYSAIWTGDNLSNYFHLKMAIPATLNLSLSGISFNGPDVGGFGATTTQQLMTDWVKTCFLFPFMRNHNSKGEGDQEPWTFSAEGLETIRKYVRLRYRLLPYLYNVFCSQEEDGDPVLRPLLYHYNATKRFSLDEVSDQFLVGDAILQAPILDAKKRARKVILPGQQPWLDLQNGAWRNAGTLRVRPGLDETPMYLRLGAMIPIRPGVPKDNRFDLTKVDLFIAAKPGTSGMTSYRYRADDGISFDYRKGKRSEILIEATWNGNAIDIRLIVEASGYGPIRISPVLPSGFESATIDGKPAALNSETIEFAGGAFACSRLVL
jgi:alpha-glucosidase